MKLKHVALISGLLSCLPASSAAQQTLDRAWVRFYAPNPAQTNHARAIRIASDGSVFVGGSSENAMNNLDYVLLKFTPGGETIWESRYDSEDHDETAAFVFDSNGDVVLTGSSRTIKVTTAGEIWWVAPVGGKDVSMDGTTAYVVGFSEVDESLAKIADEGWVVWQRTWNGEANSVDVSHKVAVDQTGNIYIAGRKTGYCHPRLPCASSVGRATVFL